MAAPAGLWQPSGMEAYLKARQGLIFGIGAVAVWLALGWPVLREYLAGGSVRGGPVADLWLVCFAIFGAALLAALAPKRRRELHWTLLGVQVAAVAAMANIVSWAGMSMFLTIVAWQVAMATTPGKALAWVAAQTLAVTLALAQALNPDLCWVIAKSIALQLLLVFTAHALRREEELARALTNSNRELRAAQSIIANTVRDEERLRISRELHDAWGHELTALGLQLEIASNVGEPRRANEHVLQAKTLARALLTKVRDVVSTLREAERCDLKEALASLAHSVPTPVIHVDVAPDVEVGADQAHVLVRCAQEAITNAVRHARATNLSLRVYAEQDGVRLVARDDGKARPQASVPGTGLLGMRERLEQLGGRLAIQVGEGRGFTVDAWLPARAPHTA
ncbi:sensor histidine kinase [uncultured Sphingomonas sp.]|uniref:sensor histidine kinase n=1 Tax=uncultured Sphingomonas sp. TaxID=158754 RepID=UPI0025F1CF90|nr:sensor histidine kinase [uncultured Sphingomonas sp.]